MENVNIRDHMDRRFDDHRAHVDKHFEQVYDRLGSIEKAARDDRSHIHPEMPTWPQVWAALSVVATLVGGLVVVLS